VSAEECWYFFPHGPGGPVITRLRASEGPGKGWYCRHLENEHANYERTENRVTINNFRMYNADLSVRRLPTDGRALSDFISGVEGRRSDMEHIEAMTKGLLVVLKRDVAEGRRLWRVDRHLAVLEEQYFRCDWPASMRVVDNRDAMHKRGWTYFTVSGQINGEEVRGKGRMPFVYEAVRAHYPWLDMRVGSELRIVDTGSEGVVQGKEGKAIARCAGGSFFEGLGRPWMGLHTIDTVRRDAAGRGVWFETKYGAGRDKAEVVVTCDSYRADNIPVGE